MAAAEPMGPAQVPMNSEVIVDPIQEHQLNNYSCKKAHL
uniref:Zinc finger protein 772 n=1 Tax=Nomascus leucogenys TaxID=61853 RepID=A0A2I3HXV2_NOMLE